MFDLVGSVTYTKDDMKNRVLLTMLILFIVVAGVCITCGTVFVVRDVEVVDATVQESEFLTAAEKNEIIEKSGLHGKNILFNLNQDKVVQNLKAYNSKLKVQSITAKFPNRVVVVVSRRVPIYYDGQRCYDAEMCVVECNQPENCINIAGANLEQTDLKLGDFATAKTARVQKKIKQLRVIGGMVDSLENIEAISYEDDLDKVPSSDYLYLKIKLSGNTNFVIKVNSQQDLRHALQYTNFVYSNKRGMEAGEYRTLYHSTYNQVYTKYFNALGECKGEYHEYEE